VAAYTAHARLVSILIGCITQRKLLNGNKGAAIIVQQWQNIYFNPRNKAALSYECMDT